MGNNYAAYTNGISDLELKDHPPRARLLADIYKPIPIIDTNIDSDDVDAVKISGLILSQFSSALDLGDQDGLHSLFFEEQSFYRDTIALTGHIRTFKTPQSITASLITLSAERIARDFQVAPGLAPGPSYICFSPTLKFIDFFFDFKTMSPRASCGGRMTILPQPAEDGTLVWKIWNMSTWLSRLDDFPEDEARLRAPSHRRWKTDRAVNTDVVVVGGGNMGLVMAARLKALGVDYLVIDENENYGDNWMKRYDFLRFHVPKSFCATPYLEYPPEASNGLTRNDLANQMKRFGQTFDINVIHETRVSSTRYDPRSQTWTLQLASKHTVDTVYSKCLVIATGLGCWVPQVPEVKNSSLYPGLTLHSHHYKNAKMLAAQGLKSVIVVGSANTAFDIIEDCYNAGLKTTMIQRSPTYIIPTEYLMNQRSLGIYDLHPADQLDNMVLSGTVQVDARLLGLTHTGFASKEPHRYDRLRAAGFQAIDSTTSDLSANLLDRAGGHFVDMGHGVELICSGKVGIKSGVTATSFTSTGLEFSDGTTLDADAVIWCTGFRDVDMRNVLPDVLGEGGQEIAQKMEAIWGLDQEGESRGLFKRHENVENFWVGGYGTSHHRWGSKVIALQIKASLEGILPAAYRETPVLKANETLTS